jgi:hypothetical protein
MPLKFWDEAFLTATYLINLLSNKVINFDTPVQCLLNETPNYSSLECLGALVGLILGPIMPITLLPLH